MTSLFASKGRVGRMIQETRQQKQDGPMVPDEDRLRLAARRKAAKRKGGRASTVMSDKLGP